MYLPFALNLLLAPAPASALPNWNCSLESVYRCDAGGACRREPLSPAPITFLLSPGSMDYSGSGPTLRGVANVNPLATEEDNGFSALVRGRASDGRPLRLVVTGTIARDGEVHAIVHREHYVGKCK